MLFEVQYFNKKRLWQCETDICRNGIEAEKDVFDSILFFWNCKDITEFLTSNFNEINTIDAVWTRRTCVNFAKWIKAVQSFCKDHEMEFPVNQIILFLLRITGHFFNKELLGKGFFIVFRECRKNIAGKH